MSTKKPRKSKREDAGDEGEEEERKNYHEFCVPKDFEFSTEKPECFSRLDVLSKPKRHSLMITYQTYNYLFPPCKNAKIRTQLQEMFALNPEDAEKYFQEMRRNAEEAALKRKVREMLRLAACKRKKRKLEQKAYRKAKRLIFAGLMYAVYNETQPIHSIRLRHLSNMILEQLCDLLDISVPDRTASDKMAVLLFTVCDWIAEEVERIFFPMRMLNTKMLNKMDWDYREMVMNEPIDFDEPIAASSRIGGPNYQYGEDENELE